jgi:hypothetical protein
MVSFGSPVVGSDPLPLSMKGVCFRDNCWNHDAGPLHIAIEEKGAPFASKCLLQPMCALEAVERVASTGIYHGSLQKESSFVPERAQRP